MMNAMMLMIFSFILRWFSRHYALQQQASLCPYAADEELLYLLTSPSSVRSDVHYSLTPFRHQQPRPSESPPIGCKA